MLDQIAIAALNFLLRRSPWSAQRLRPFAGREARLMLPPFTIDFRIDRDGLLQPALRATPDVDIALPADAPLAALSGADTLMGKARISGSADFAEALGFALRNLEWDAEEDLSRLFGDMVAHRLAALGRSFAAWQAEAVRRLGENAAEYLQYENRQLASRREMDDFAAETRRLRRDAERLEERLVQLERLAS
ncbi:MAG: ubiquinone biosynthesis accessory factor UbiJ [Pseudomonadota bacterium]